MCLHKLMPRMLMIAAKCVLIVGSFRNMSNGKKIQQKTLFYERTTEVKRNISF